MKLRWLWAAVLLFSVTIRAENFHESIQQALDKIPHPDSPADFQPLRHLTPLNQGNTQICWSYATSSFLESEMARQNMKSVRLSVTYPLYCVLLEKTKRFVNSKGQSRFAPGDLFHGVLDVCPEYGAIPAGVYGRHEETIFDHGRFYADLNQLMSSIKASKSWNERRALSRLKKILNQYLGEPPKTFLWNGKVYTPQSFFAENVKLPWADYRLVTSFADAPFHTFTELKVPDNWAHHTNYFNVPLDEFYTSLKSAVQSGFSVAMDIDNTEPSYKETGRYGIVPDFDIPAANINQAARELRFSNGSTTDDHLVQIVGYKNFGGEDWFLVKDSAQSIWKKGSEGYIFLHSSYVKLKVLAFLVHKDALPKGW